MQTILLVDDEEFFRERLTRAFTGRGFTVFAAADYEEAMAIIEKSRPAIGVFDLRMPGKSGLDLVAAAKKVHPEMRIVVLTGYGSIATATEAVKLGALNYLPKPADVDDIIKSFSEDASPAGEENSDFDPPSLARVEWEHINRVLNDCGGNISAAAKKLGVHRRTLQRKLYKYAPNK